MMSRASLPPSRLSSIANLGDTQCVQSQRRFECANSFAKILICHEKPAGPARARLRLPRAWITAGLRRESGESDTPCLPSFFLAKSGFFLTLKRRFSHCPADTHFTAGLDMDFATGINREGGVLGR